MSYRVESVKCVLLGRIPTPSHISNAQPPSPTIGLAYRDMLSPPHLQNLANYSLTRCRAYGALITSIFKERSLHGFVI